MSNEPKNRENEDWKKKQKPVERVIDTMTAIGEWEEHYTGRKKKVNRCKDCLFVSIQGRTRFCPNCGKRMIGGK